MARGVSKRCEALWTLENAIGALCKAEDHLDVADTRIANRLRTLDEADDLREIRQAREAIAEAKETLADFHPHALKRKRDTK